MSSNFKSLKIKAIIGLGNPDEKYVGTFHNAGIHFVEYMADRMKLDEFDSFSRKPFSFSRFGNLYLIKSGVFMNKSGEAFLKAMDHFNLKPEELLVVHDDSDIRLGEYKIVFDRGSAGHKGIDDIIKKTKTKNFWRLRLGIRPSEEVGTRKKAEDFVLKKMGLKGKGIMEKALEKATEEILALL